MARHDGHSWHRQVAHERHNPYKKMTPMMTKTKRSKRASKRDRVPALAVMLISTVAACLVFAPAFGAV